MTTAHSDSLPSSALNDLAALLYRRLQALEEKVADMADTIVSLNKDPRLSNPSSEQPPISFKNDKDMSNGHDAERPASLPALEC
ncbi:hypothetical protein HDU98_003674, partial [Podochytrium sp. JEL0797]